MRSDGARPDVAGVMRPRARHLLLMAALLATSACGDSPLQSIGLRSSDWINEPTVPSTQAVVTTVPTVVASGRLLWANDTIVTQNLGNPEELLREIFARREGDRFIQASRAEIVAALPELAFPSVAPTGAEWVSSQLVFDNDGTIADDPSVAFGIWSAEPYTRSRSVAQMIVIRVANDPDVAAEINSGTTEATCAQFSDRNTEQCEVITLGERPVWVLGASAGSTLVWFEGSYRYEMFGRSFVPPAVLQRMTDGMTPLSSLAQPTS